MADDDDLGRTKHRLMTGEGAATILYLLNNPIGALEVFLDKLPDARIVGVHLVGRLRRVKMRRWAMEGNVVDEGYRSVGNLRLQDMSNIVMEDRHRVCPTHRQSDEAMCAEWGLERRIVM